MLWWILLCFTAAAATALLSPCVLTLGRWQLLRPRIALTAWFGAFFLGLLFILAGLVGSVLGAIGASEAVSTRESVLLTVAGWLGLGIFGAIIALVSVSVEPLVELNKLRTVALVPIASSRKRHGRLTLVRFHSTEPIAFALPGRRPEIFLSSAVEQLLTPAQIQAVIAHEYAHLRQHHGWALRIAHINTMCLAGRWPGRAFQPAITLLVELAADDAAARQAGAAHLANALTILGEASGDQGMRLRASRLTERRWPRVSQRRLPEVIQHIA
ncbi:M48 family metalloprotease [Microbacterium sp. YY-01]|uniref:M48 family metalloprotease n=1 Tax=Microbacterium sp. YY-01 TaxID=3421634 RepID=UPI003D16B6D1